MNFSFKPLTPPSNPSFHSSLRSKQKKSAFRAFHQNFLTGNLRGAVRYLTDRVGGVEFSPDDVIGDRQTVRDALLEKHPESGILSAASLQDFKVMSRFAPGTITADHVMTSQKIRGSAGLGGLDANKLSQLILRYKEISGGLHHEVAEFTMWLANGFPPYHLITPSCQVRIQAFIRSASVNHGATCSPTAFLQ